MQAYPQAYPYQQPILRPYPGAINAQQVSSGNASTMVENVAIDVPYVQPPPQRVNMQVISTARVVPVVEQPPPVVAAPVAVVEAPCPPATCWSRSSAGTIAMYVLIFLLLIASVILLFVVDLSTIQIAVTSCIAVAILFGAIQYFMSCECGATLGPNGACLQVPGGCSTVLA